MDHQQVSFDTHLDLDTVLLLTWRIKKLDSIVRHCKYQPQVAISAQLNPDTRMIMHHTRM
jgi:hypothetical protein